MNPTDKTLVPLENLHSLPAFARYLLTEKLDEYCRVQLRIGHELELPMLKYFASMPEEEQLALTKQGASEFLDFLARNDAAAYIPFSIQRWKTNHLPIINRDAVVAEDITLANYLRKKTMLYFIQAFTQKPEEILALVGEIDLFQNALLTSSTNTYIDLLKERIEEHMHLIQKVNETVPGALYVFDLREFKSIYSNNKISSIIGYGHEELNRLGESALSSLLHPDDEEVMRQQLETLKTAKDGETLVCRYRIRDKDGTYRWLANHESVFKRDEDGSVLQTIGITLDATNEQTIISENQLLIKKLSRSEALYKKAEEIANMGNWAWYVKKNRLDWTDQLYRIYGLEPQSEEITIDRFLSFIHPDDREFVSAGVEKLHSESSLDYTFRIITANGTTKWLRSIAHVIRDKEGRVSTIIGIEQDVTEKQRLIDKLQESQRLYKQAQELSHMGNFSWDIKTNEVFWSDEVYKIYERPFGTPVRFEDAFTSIVDEHKTTVQKAIQQVVFTKEGQSVNYAIRLADGRLRYINLHTDVRLDKEGNVRCIVGTAQDVTEKEELIERLQQSEKLFKQAQALSHLGSWVYDLQTKEVTWSDELYAIYEREKGKPLTYEEWFSFVNPVDRDTVREQFRLAIEEKKPMDIIHSIVLESGKKKVLHRKGEAIFDASGNALKIVGSTQDVTEQFRVQNELMESQIFIRKITDATPSIITTYNVNSGQYTFVSEGIIKLLGYQPADVLEKGIDFFINTIHPDDLPELLDKNAKALEKANEEKDKSNVVAEFIYRVRHKNGSWRWLHTYGTVFDYNSQGRVENILNISLDVTDQMQASEKIKEQEHFIQQIADASPTILYLFDVPTQSMAYINREAFFVLGYLPDEILEEGANITDFLYHPEDMALLPCRKQSTKAFQQVDSMIQYECRMKHKDGDYRWLLVREIVFKTGEDGSIRQIIGAALDINRRKEMERTILQNTLQLEQSNASLEEFAYVASHDLKEPLRKISTFGDRLVASQIDRLNDDGKIYLRKIVDASQRMQNMISDLLSISMISGNRSFEMYSLQKILEETVQTLEYKIESQHAVIRYEQLPEVSIIPSQFRQLFQNLLANSLKFVREDVQPVIAITCSEADAYEVAPYQLAKANRYIKIRFADNGIGFENEYAQKIFAIFQRLHGRSEYEGSGIGLAICKKIVEHHGGVIFAEGKPGEGATFTIILPA
ncbi:PAS domain-containing protein [Flavisolibacter nicotianae]|uniref:PAS domain-containing protein n=1 Tax=Flavisolibacter nicotianae TaxID=2364882 RepID=UPI0013C3F2EE|nr:PAS domain-containing protein [Flavisolibacter nicotianae]